MLHLLKRVKQGSIAGACQPSRWGVTLVDVPALGTPLGVWKEGLASPTFQWSVAVIQAA